VKLNPAIIVFDVDGVLVDVRRTFLRCTLETVRHFTGRRVRAGEVHAWKNRSGYNDDWRLTTDWIRTLGRRVPYETVKRKYMEFYWGTNGNGYVRGERWLLDAAALRRLARRAELSLFTGRTREELRHTLTRFGTAKHFRAIVTFDDVRQGKPHPEGLLRILDSRAPSTAVYVGDNVDDALAARAAGVAFVGVLPRGSDARRVRAPRLRELGALTVLGHAGELEAWLAR
jgi:HAD superfamily hydrolase (TIGR01548 family)